MHRPACTIEHLVTSHYQSVYRYAVRLAGVPGDAEDLTQEAYRIAHEKLHQLRDADRARPWLFSIVRNLFLLAGRQRQRGGWVSLDDVEAPSAPPPPLEAVDPAELQQALNDLPEEFRTPLILFYFDECSYRDIADQMQVPLGTVMSRLARGKAYLRRRLVPLEAAQTGTVCDGM
ncbi:MAG TPA: sigma-70 family RNA polymerase sigma factor [Gemmatales bacterium]|nr:sigma-70 family RNA polymerase sigma factor [Gemmatales bacterium]HMP57857.1 sigma-70 family RNA polymerase sigma factor [Gemmatales bacterium]